MQFWPVRFTSCPLGWTVFSDIISVCPSFSIGDRVAHFKIWSEHYHCCRVWVLAVWTRYSWSSHIGGGQKSTLALVCCGLTKTCEASRPWEIQARCVLLVVTWVYELRMVVFCDVMLRHRVIDSWHFEGLWHTVMRRLTAGIRSEKCIIRWFCRRVNVIECNHTNLDSIAYYIPRLYGRAYSSYSTNLYSILLYWIL